MAMEGVAEAFLEVDKAKRGSLSMDALVEVFEHMGESVGKEDVKEIMDLVGHQGETVNLAQLLIAIQARNEKEVSSPPSFNATPSLDVESKLKRQLTEISSVPAEKKEELKKLFLSLDKDGDGGLTFKEYKQIMDQASKISYTKEELEASFKEADEDGNGFVDFLNFLAQWAKDHIVEEIKAPEKKKVARLSSPERKKYLSASAGELLLAKFEHADAEELNEIEANFKRYDTTNSGDLTLEEFQAALEVASEEQFSPTEMKALFDRIDLNKDGKIQFEEFCQHALSSKATKLVEVKE
mmetsp:Transcript_2959/g.4355  ORF Transcript_2959/g.4355 Transcript_2959/m.4355 type:complete len:297 (+) Transcript_2959:1-891(+)